MAKQVLTYVYFKNLQISDTVQGSDPDRYMRNLRKIVNHGFFDYVEYSGELNCTCGGTDDFGPHYSFIIVASIEKTKEILSSIEYDIVENFDKNTFEKLDEHYRTFDEKVQEEVG